MAKKDKMRFYTLEKIRKACPDATYFMVMGKRSNGKTFSGKEAGLDEYLASGRPMAIIRRWDEDFKGQNGPTWWNDFIINPFKGNILKEKSKGRWNSIVYLHGAWWLQRVDEEKGEVSERDTRAFCYKYSLNGEEHAKGVVLPDVKTIIFDEFITRKYYLPQEFVTFQNLLKSLIRNQEDVTIYMFANTINRYCPYFAEMGLTNAKDMKKGTIDVYTYGQNEYLKVAIEYCDEEGGKSKKNEAYFAFDNPHLKMISQGDWEIDIYPHMPISNVLPKEILFIYFVKWEGDILQCEIIERDGNAFTYIHRKTTPIKDEDEDLVYDIKTIDYRGNHRTNILKPTNELERRLAWFYGADKVFYQDNEVGEIVRNYLMACKRG